MASYKDDPLWHMKALHEWCNERDAVGIYEIISSPNGRAPENIVAFLRIDGKYYGAGINTALFDSFYSLFNIVVGIGDMKKVTGGKVVVDVNKLREAIARLNG